MNTKKLVLGGLFAAIITLVTLIALQIPGGGYINLGDSIIFLGVYLAGPVFGTLAAAVGSALSDLISGYAIYIPATFLIKGLTAIAFSLFVKKFISKKVSIKEHFGRLSVCVFLSELIVPIGYFVYEFFIIDFSAAFLGVPYNLIQAVACSVLGAALLVAVFKRNIS